MIPIRQLHVRLTPVKLDINWAYILAFVTFWVYGYYGAVSSPNYAAASMGVTVVSLTLFLFYLAVARTSEVFRDSITLSHSDLAVWAAYLSVLCFISYPYLLQDITVDQLYHAQSSHSQAYTLVTLLSGYMPSLDDRSLAGLIRLADVAVLLALVLVAFLIRTRSTTAIVVLVVLFLLARFFVYSTFTGTDPYPQLRALPLWSGSIILGVHGIAFRVASLSALAALMWIVHRLSCTKVAAPVSLLLGLAAGTVPVLFHAGTLVEFSIWTALLFTAVALRFDGKLPSHDVHWVRWFSVIGIFLLIRLTAVAALAFLALLFFYSVIRHRALRPRDVALTLSPILPALLIFAKAMYWGTPGSNIGGDVAESAAQRVWISLFSGTSWEVLRSSFHWPLLTFFALGFLPSNRKLTRPAAATPLFFGILYFMFYAAPTWGFGRYQAEYVVPFIILGLVKFATVVGHTTPGRAVVTLALALLTVSNIYIFRNLPRYSREITIDYPHTRAITAIISADTNNYIALLKDLKGHGLSDVVFLCDQWTYGVLPQVLSGYSVKEVRAAASMFERHFVPTGGSVVGNERVCFSDAVQDDDAIRYMVLDGRNADVVASLSDNWRNVSHQYGRTQPSHYLTFAKRN